MKLLWKKIRDKLPKYDGFSLSWPPSINFSTAKKNGTRNLDQFKNLLEHSQWEKEFINHKEVWINKEDNTFQIERGDYVDEFREPWVEVYPDPVGSKYPVYLKINTATVKELTFIACDGGRIFVPLPELESENNKTIYIWRRDSLPYKVCQIIGEYYIYKNIEGISQRSKIRIV